MTDSRHEGNNAVDEERGDAGPADGGRAEKRSPHSIRFLDPEWERIEAYAETRGLTGPEFVRFAALAAMEAGPPPSAAGDRLAPLIEMTFRATYIMATKMRDEMLDAGRKEELDELVAAARGLQDEILGGEPARRKRVDEGGFPRAAPANGDRAAGRSAISAQPPAIHSWRVDCWRTCAIRRPVVRVGNEAEIHASAASVCPTGHGYGAGHRSIVVSRDGASSGPTPSVVRGKGTKRLATRSRIAGSSRELGSWTDPGDRQCTADGAGR